LQSGCPVTRLDYLKADAGERLGDMLPNGFRVIDYEYLFHCSSTQTGAFDPVSFGHYEIRK
jgi:hypothetical protein